MHSKNEIIILRYNNYSDILEEYLNLKEFNTLSPLTISSKRVTITSFMNYLGDNNVKDFHHCLHKNIIGYLSSLSNLSSSTISSRKFILRHFLNYLNTRGLTIFSGNELFPVIFTNKRERILSFYSIEEIRQTISVINRNTPYGKRDFAVVLLAAELGIRSGDIIRLKMSNIHWEHDTIEFIQHKTKVFNQLPLLENIKYALIDYLKNGRPKSDSDYIFIGIRNGGQPLTNTCIHQFVSKYFKKAGVDISERKHGPHAMRHSLASSMLHNNTPMHVIKEVLGHSNINTTKLYLNIDVDSLRKVAVEGHMKQYDIFNFPETYRNIAMEYIDYKHSLGFKYAYHEQSKVNNMLDFIYSNSQSNPILTLQPELVNAYVSKRGNESSRTLHARQSHIRQFALFLNLRGISAYVYPEKLVRVIDDFIPYIFTKNEVKRILQEADSIGPNRNKFVNTPHIYPAVIRVLYGCGLRISEALGLKCEHVDLDNGILVMMNGKNNVSRLVPMSDSLRQYLSIYDSKVERKENPYFFPALHNERYSPTTIRSQFRRLEEKAGISQLSNGKYPRLHDLRHTFSVHALEQMIQKGMDPYCSLPILSTYLGHKGIESTEKYLRLTKQYFIDILQFSHDNAEKIFPEV